MNNSGAPSDFCTGWSLVIDSIAITNVASTYRQTLPDTLDQSKVHTSFKSTVHAFL